MRLYDSKSRNIEPLEPRDGEISIYVCGITPYDTTHLGHAFTYTMADVLIRYLKFNGVTVKYVQNVTDIDDDILRKAKEEGEDWRALGDRWTAHFITDMKALNVLPPDQFPRATDVIPEIIAATRDLLAAGVAYEADGNVYYSVDAWDRFGELSRLPRAEMLPIANERGNHPDDPHKRDPLDFVLWQAQSEDEPSWDSPWGPGRPGWHIECSTMAGKYLGDTVDIHGGGADLLFPHHECEIAQAEPLIGKQPFTRFWMHVAMVRHDGEKMSKSLGNLVMVRDLLQDYSQDAIRLYLARHHYRQPWSHDLAELQEAEASWVEALRGALAVSGGDGEVLSASEAEKAFRRALDNDLDTSGAIDALLGLAGKIGGAAAKGQDVHAAQGHLRAMAGVFGLRLDVEGSEERVLSGWDVHLARFTNS
jgi:L-cysteine:1D-myo-inositol 2-amino-2-deoxy-alpha-D-glucopyranoside ligase